jgi:hypothetical protein
MIPLNEETEKDFLNREWSQKMIDAGINMSDAKYYIVVDISNDCDAIVYEPDCDIVECNIFSIYVDGHRCCNWMPTYTTSELIGKLNNWVSSQHADESNECIKLMNGKWYVGLESSIVDRFYSIEESKENTFIESLASLLIQCSIEEKNNV